MNDVHFTNVIVNVLENAIKYSPDVPDIDVYEEKTKTPEKTPDQLSLSRYYG
jgi:signal transduction histidine kinase